ncbi:cyclic nucleotide-binding domain-containing protein [Desulfonauticus submarinus]
MFDLKKISFFKELSREQEEKIAALLQKIEVEAGVPFIKEGEFGTEMFILISGRVKVVKQMLKPEVAEKIPFLQETEKVLAVLEGKDFPVLGEVALVDSDKRSATIYTLTPCVFLKLSQKNFFHLIQSEPELGLKIVLNIAKNLAFRLRKANDDVIKLTTALALVLHKKNNL